MAPVVASADIAALITAFAPPLPTKAQPSLVRSLSGNSLLNSRKVLARFRVLLETSPDRIRLRDLPSRLGIRDSSWILDCYGGPVHLNYDKESLVPQSEFATIYEGLKARAERAIVDIATFSAEYGLDSRSLEERGSADEDLKFYRDPYAPRNAFVSGAAHMNEVEQQLERMLPSTAVDKVNLSLAFSHVPKFIIRDLLGGLQSRNPKLDGSIVEFGTEIEYMPSGYSAAQREKQQESRNVILQQSLRLLNDHGYCVLPRTSSDEPSEVTQELESSWTKQAPVPDDDLESLITDDGSFVVLKAGVWANINAEWQDIALNVVEGSSTSKSVDVSNLEAAIIKRSTNSELNTLLLQSRHRDRLEGVLADATQTVERRKSLRFAGAFSKAVLAPLSLYTAGIVADATLKQHQEEYLCEYFRSDIIPRFLETAREQNLLPMQKTRVRDTEKLLQACNQTKTLTEVQSAVEKFCKKQGIFPVNETLEREVRIETLQQKVKAMQRMTRASDVLQNLIWILLASSSGGLYMSAGRDTSRMIKQYQLVGDGAIGKRLEEWRDLLKTGKEGREDLQEMREMAMRAVEEMDGGC